MGGGRNQESFLGQPLAAGSGISGITRQWRRVLVLAGLCACLPLPAPTAGAAGGAAIAGDSAAALPKGSSDKGGAGFSLSGAHSHAPINIDAKVLEFDARRNIAVFRGDVVTKQGEVVVKSAMLTVKFARPEGDDGTLSRAESVVAEGDVRITRGDRVARGQRAEFNDAERTIVLSGGAVLNEGSNEVRGERLIVYLDENRSVVEATNSRVKAVLITGANGAKERPGGMSPEVMESERKTSVDPQPPARGQAGGPASMVGE